MRDSDADIAINTLNKLITQELKAARAGSCQGNRPLEECATTRYNTYAFGGLDSGRSGQCRSRRIGGMSAGCRSIRLRGGAPMIYLIVDGELVDILTEMDEALAKAKKLAEHAGKVEIADLVTGRRTIIKQARKGNRR